MDRVKGLYTTWLESAPVTRLSLRQSVLSQRPPQDRHQRVEQRAAVLLLESLPEELRHEVVSVRAVTVEAMIFLVHCAYQPGGAGEKAHLLQFLTSPEVGSGLDGTLQLARKWVRLLRRGRELQLVLPDPSLLCRGLDRVVSATFSGNKHPSASFRIASFKLERQLDYKATLVDAEDYAYLVVGELEAALLAQPLPAPPKVARMDDAKAAEEASKGKGKSKQQRPCWSWRKWMQVRQPMHVPALSAGTWSLLGVWVGQPLGQGGNPTGGGGGGGQSQNSSSSVHVAASSATTTSDGGGKGAGDEKPSRKKGGGKAKDAVRKAEENGQAEGGSTATTTTAPSSTAPASSAAPESAPEEFFEEASEGPEVSETCASHAGLDLLRAAVWRCCQYQSSGGLGSHYLNEVSSVGLPTRRVLLAEGEAMFYQLPGGTLLTKKKTSPILAMSGLMEIGCRVSWSNGEGCRITHPTRGWRRSWGWS